MADHSHVPGRDPHSFRNFGALLPLGEREVHNALFPLRKAAEAQGEALDRLSPPWRFERLFHHHRRFEGEALSGLRRPLYGPPHRVCDVPAHAEDVPVE